MTRMSSFTARLRERVPGGGAGFTLIELMIVIAILGLLAAVLLPNIMGAKDTASEVATESTMLRLENACKKFDRKHGVFPPADFRFPDRGSSLQKKTTTWKPDNGRNTGIESLVAFVSQSRSGGTDLSDFADKLSNTDKDEHGIELPLLRHNNRVEVADAWNTPVAYWTKFTMDTPQIMVGMDGEAMTVSAHRNAAGKFHGAGKFQFLSAGKDGTFGTDDDLPWPRN